MLVSKGGRTLSEIIEQKDRWLDAIKIYNKERETLIWIKKMRFEQVVFTGCGASFAASIFAAQMFRAIGKLFSMSFHASEILMGDTIPFDMRRRTLVIPLSKSGETAEVVWAMERLRKIQPDIAILSVTCNGNSPLAGMATKSWALDQAMDDGLIAVKSFSTTLFILALAAGALGGNGPFLTEMSKLPKAIDIKKYHNELIKMRHLADFKSASFCGENLNRGLARYGAIIVKEMSITPTNYYNSMEYRHGHYVAATPNNMYFFILSEKNKKTEVEAMRDAAKMKAQIFLIGEDIDPGVEAGVEYSIKLESKHSPYARAFFTIPVIQLIAYQHSITKGMNPDRPKHLTGTVLYKNKPEF